MRNSKNLAFWRKKETYLPDYSFNVFYKSKICFLISTKLYFVLSIASLAKRRTGDQDGDPDGVCTLAGESGSSQRGASKAFWELSYSRVTGQMSNFNK